MHGPTCIFWANLTPWSLQRMYRCVDRDRALNLSVYKSGATSPGR
jgi:hypothetical protein